MEFVVGVDIGGTSTRALALGLDGSVLGRGASEGSNPNSHPPEVAVSRIGSAVSGAIGAVDPEGAWHVVLGVAGVSKLSDPVVAGLLNAALAELGLPCAVTAVSDAEVAFASATASPDGTVLIGGTGSIAMRIVDHRVESRVGGYGWLLGDEGSAFWLGREAVRATLRALQSADPLGPLPTAVLAEADLGVGERKTTFARLITAANAEPPIRLARFASLVSAHSVDDPAARAIVEQAASILADMAREARSPGESTPIVLVGSVVGPTTPVGELLRATLPGPVLSAADGSAGAAWLAALKAVGPTAARPAL